MRMKQTANDVMMWAIQPDALERAQVMTAPSMAMAAEAYDVGAPTFEAAGDFGGVTAGNVAVIRLRGVIVPRGSQFMEQAGYITSLQSFARVMRQAAGDASVGHIVIDVDSPGGQVSGVPEMAAIVREIAVEKPVTAVANHLMASAAYWIGSAASTLVATPSAQVGSIGVFATHLDYSAALAQKGIAVTLIAAGAHKTDGNPYEPLSDDARAAIQETVNTYYDQFVADVAAGRGVRVEDVRGGYGEGRVLTANAAMAAGMIDRIATLDDVMASLTGGRSAGVRAERDTEREYRERRQRAYSRPIVLPHSDE
ncbi:MAG: S49 family peptidase [Chloroflexi bacterium]|nr:MAG: S49 family peptidase [Chloroflexota bacterium]